MDCDTCRKRTEIRHFTRNPEGLGAVCSVCGQTVPVPLEILQHPQPVPDTTDVCPKCQAPRDTGTPDACKRCGLVYEKWVEPPSPFSGHPQLEAAWERIRSLPPGEPSHDEFLEMCFKTGNLPDAVRVYRMLGEQTGQDTSTRIRQIQLLSQMEFRPSRPVDKRYAWLVWLLIALVTLSLLYIWTITPDDLFR